MAVPGLGYDIYIYIYIHIHAHIKLYIYICIYIGRIGLVSCQKRYRLFSGAIVWGTMQKTQTIIGLIIRIGFGVLGHIIRIGKYSSLYNNPGAASASLCLPGL